MQASALTRARRLLWTTNKCAAATSADACSALAKEASRHDLVSLVNLVRSGRLVGVGIDARNQAESSSHAGDLWGRRGVSSRMERDSGSVTAVSTMQEMRADPQETGPARHRDQYRALMPALARDFTVIAVDQRGMGLTESRRAGTTPPRAARRDFDSVDSIKQQRGASAGSGALGRDRRSRPRCRPAPTRFGPARGRVLRAARPHRPRRSPGPVRRRRAAS